MALSATPIHTQRGGGSSKHTNGIAACIARDKQRQIQTNGCQHSSKRLTVCPHQRRTHTHPSHQSTSTAPSQPAVWPCQMTYDTQHLRPIGGGALSNAHTHRWGEEQQAHKRHRCMHCKRHRETDPKQWVSALEQETYILSSPKTHPHTPIPPVQQHIAASKPASRVAVSDDI